MDPVEGERPVMIEIWLNDTGEVAMSGRCHAGHADVMREVLGQVSTSIEVNFAQLDYISSAGLGVLLGAQKRLSKSGHALTLVNLNAHIREVFRIAGFDKVFEVR